MAGALFIGCESEPEATPELEAMSKEDQEESIAAIKEIAGSKVTLTPKFTVDLHNTKVTDAGLEHLKGLTGLQGLSLERTKVTDGGLAKLQAALPKCHIGR